MVALGMGLLFAASVGWYFFRGGKVQADSPGKPVGEWVTVQAGDFEVSYREDGELKPVKVTTIGFTEWGRVAWLVDEGSRVEKGEKLVSLETERLEEEVQQIQDELSVAELNLAQQQQNQELEQKRWETTMLAEKDRLDLALTKEREVLNKPSELDRQEAANTLKSAQARVAAAKADYEALAPLVEKGYANRADVEAKQLALRLAENELERAKLKTGDILDGASSEERRKANLDRGQAEAAFKLKELERDQQLANNRFQVRAAEFAVEKHRERLARRKKNLEESTRTAPHPGIVVYRTVGWDGNKKVSIGDNVGPWMSPIDLPSYEWMKVRTQVPESVVRRLMPRREGEGGATVAGSAARVRVKTLPGKVYPAEVTWIDGWARDRNAKLSESDIKNKGLSGVRVFDVEVELKESDPERLRDGFRAVVEFPTEMLANVIAIPAHAVKNVGGKATVQVLDDGETRQHAVKLGPESGGRVVVAEGLKAGDKVLVPPKPPEEAEPLKPAGGGNGNAATKDAGVLMPMGGSKREGGAGGGSKRGPGGGGRKR